MALACRRGTSMRAIGQVSAHDHGLTACPVLMVSVKACSSRTCASWALACIHKPCADNARPAAQRSVAAMMCDRTRDLRRFIVVIRKSEARTQWGTTICVRGARSAKVETGFAFDRAPLVKRGG